MPNSPSPEGCAASLGRELLHLSLHTDYGLRLLMRLTLVEPGAWIATPTVAQRFDCSAPGNKVCRGVWTRQQARHAACMEAQP